MVHNAPVLDLKLPLDRRAGTMARMARTTPPPGSAHTHFGGGADPFPDLHHRWATAVAGARDGRGSTGPDPAPYADNLLSRWSEPQRRYHTTAHLIAVLDRVDELAVHATDLDAGAPVDWDVVRLAVWFHDAVYRPERSENEERSAALAERALPELGINDACTAEVARLVRLTTGHDPAPDDHNGAALCDADLAVLASPPEQYAAYAAAVREEYVFVPDREFRAGRADILRRLLDMENLFHTPYGKQQWERVARRNLTTELELLTVG